MCIEQASGLSFLVLGQCWSCLALEDRIVPRQTRQYSSHKSYTSKSAKDIITTKVGKHEPAKEFWEDILGSAVSIFQGELGTIARNQSRVRR
jgi:hypothetical protein